MWPAIIVGGVIAWLTSACGGPKASRPDENENGDFVNKSEADVYETAKPKATWAYERSCTWGANGKARRVYDVVWSGDCRVRLLWDDSCSWSFAWVLWISKGDGGEMICALKDIHFSKCAICTMESKCAFERHNIYITRINWEGNCRTYGFDLCSNCLDRIYSEIANAHLKNTGILGGGTT